MCMANQVHGPKVGKGPITSRPPIIPMSTALAGPSLFADDTQLVYACADLGDPCAEMLDGVTDYEVLDATDPEVQADQHYLDRVIEVRRGSTVLITDAVIVGRVDLAGGERRYVGCEDVVDTDGTPLVFGWLSDEAEPFYSAWRFAPDELLAKRVYRTEGARLVEIFRIDRPALAGRDGASRFT